MFSIDSFVYNFVDFYPEVGLLSVVSSSNESFLTKKKKKKAAINAWSQFILEHTLHLSYVSLSSLELCEFEVHIHSFFLGRANYSLLLKLTE